MAKAVLTSRLIKFGDFEVDLDKGEVRKNGLKLKLRGQPFQVLAILLEHPGEVVTRQEFQQRLWTNDDTFVDFEHGLNAIVNRLREILDDSPEYPHFIETVPRRGYRWMLPSEGSNDQSIAAPRRRRSALLFWAAALLVVLVVAGGVLRVLRLLRSSPKSSAPALTSVPLTARPGFEAEPNFSPDGKEVAFSWHDGIESKSHIYVKLIGTGGPPMQLTNGPGWDGNPVWSPDGRFFAFLRDLPEKTEVLVIPALGGPERKIGETRLGSVPGPYMAWSPDGNSLVVSHKGSPNEPAALFVVAIDTGEKHKLTSPPVPLTSDASGDTNPAFSPDGRMLAFIRMIDLHPKLYLMPVSVALQPAGEIKEIPLGHLNEGYLKGFAPVWTEDGREIVLCYWREGLWRIDVSRSAPRFAEPQQLPFGENAVGPAISHRGHRLAYTNESFQSSIWRMAARSGRTARDGTSGGTFTHALISSTQADSAPLFSPDGKRIAFVSTRSGHFEIWVCNSDGSNPVQVTSFHGPQVTTPRWSPDGTRIAFDSNAEREFDIWVVGADGGRPVRMTTHPANDGNPSWSHDGRWIYFDSMRTGEQQAWKMPAEGGEAIQLTRDGGWAPLESPDGKFLYYTKYLGGTSVWRVPLDGGQAIKVFEGLSDYINLALVDKGIYFIPVQHEASGSSIQFLDLQTNQIRRVASFERPLGSGLALSPDGQWILYSPVDKLGAELRLVENFH
jgi:Tol biopolymer transport system component/DNA-binding winged helix-turn-helix (wHTH) protein